MKKIKGLLGIWMAFLFATGAQAQETTSTFSLGPMIGFGHAGITNVSGQNSVFKPSYAAGLTATYSTVPHWAVGLDVFYSLEGAAFENSYSETDVDLHYLRVPLRVGYYFGDVENRFRPKITVGPSFAYLINSDVRYSGSSTGARITNNFESWDLGVNASLGFNYRLMENFWLNTDLGYYYGFIDAMGNDNYNTNLGLKVGVAFGL